jgi:long-chain acyl-CoA synthetase
MSAYPWRENYPPSVPHEINPDLYPSLIDLLEDCFQKFQNNVAYENMGKQVTYSELDEQSKAFASYLQNDLGLKPGDRLAIQMPNVLQIPVVLFGSIRAGITVVNTNPLYTPSEMRHQFNDAGVKAVVILANFANHLEEVLPDTSIEHVIVSEIGDMLGGFKGALINFVVKRIKKMVPSYHLPNAKSFKSVMKNADSSKYVRPVITSDHIAFLQYTGGTTGVSKGAMLTHRNMVANLEQVSAWMGTSKLELGKEIFITALPLYHIFALTVNAFLCAKLGAKSVLITNPRDMKGFVKEMGKHPYTFITGVNTLFNGLLNTPGFADIDHSNLKVSIAGGMALQRFVAEKWQKVTGMPVAEGYGLTETSPVLCVNPLDETMRIGFIGLPVPSTDIVMLDDDGKEVPYGERGELCAKGPQVMKGYWNRPEETKESFIGEFFKTGDIAVQDPDGFIRIVDRKKEMILVSGFNVYPNEVEECIVGMEKVLEVGVIAVPDAKSTEAVKAYIVKADKSLTEEEVMAHCKENLTGYKRPKYVAFTDELPKSNVGKIMRRILKEQDLKENTYE